MDSHTSGSTTGPATENTSIDFNTAFNSGQISMPAHAPEHTQRSGHTSDFTPSYTSGCNTNYTTGHSSDRNSIYTYNCNPSYAVVHGNSKVPDIADEGRWARRKYPNSCQDSGLTSGLTSSLTFDITTELNDSQDFRWTRAQSIHADQSREKTFDSLEPIEQFSIENEEQSSISSFQPKEMETIKQFSIGSEKQNKSTFTNSRSHQDSSGLETARQFLIDVKEAPVSYKYEDRSSSSEKNSLNSTKEKFKTSLSSSFDHSIKDSIPEDALTNPMISINQNLSEDIRTDTLISHESYYPVEYKPMRKLNFEPNKPEFDPQLPKMQGMVKGKSVTRKKPKSLPPGCSPYLKSEKLRVLSTEKETSPNQLGLQWNNPILPRPIELNLDWRYVKQNSRKTRLRCDDNLKCF